MPCPKNARILIVDDSVSFLSLLKAQLNELGFHDVSAVASAIDAISLLNNSVMDRNPIQLIISDWNMPEMTGQDFLKMVRNMDSFRKIPFLMLTAEKDREKILIAAATGVSGYLIKPVDPSTIQDKLDRAWK